MMERQLDFEYLVERLAAALVLPVGSLQPWWHALVKAEHIFHQRHYVNQEAPWVVLWREKNNVTNE